MAATTNREVPVSVAAFARIAVAAALRRRFFLGVVSSVLTRRLSAAATAIRLSEVKNYFAASLVLRRMSNCSLGFAEPIRRFHFRAQESALGHLENGTESLGALFRCRAFSEPQALENQHAVWNAKRLQTRFRWPLSPESL